MDGSQWVVVWDTCALMKDLWVGYQVTMSWKVTLLLLLLLFL